MGKNHHKRMKEYEQDQDHAGWMSGIFSLFDFRRGGSSNRPPSDKRHWNKVRGERFSQDMNGCVNSAYEFDDGTYDSSQPMLGVGKQSAKSLIKEDMVTDDNKKLKRNDSFMEFVDFADEADTNTLVREILIRIQRKHSREVKQEEKDSFCTLPEKIRAKFVNQLTDATRVILNAKLIGRMPVGLDGKVQYSREFIDALETIMSHKDLFFKLLEDPNSELTRSVNNLINSELGKCIDQKESEELHYHKPSLFSRLRVRSQEVRLLNSDESSEVPRSSAILESGYETSSSSFFSSSPESKSKRRSSFSFAEIKRKLIRAMGIEEVFPKNAMARNISRKDSFGRMSPSRNPHLEVEVHPKRLSSSRWSDFESKDTADRAVENELVKPSEKKNSNSYVELRKHSFHFLDEEISYEKFSKKRNLDFTWKSFSMFDRAHLRALRADRQSSMPAARTRYSSLKNSLSSNNDSHAAEQENTANAVADILSDHSMVVEAPESDEDFCAKPESHNSSPILSENIVFGDGKVAEKLSFKSSSADVICTDHGTQDITDEDCKAPLQTISANSYLGIDKTEKFEEVTNTPDNRPSPTSVLEPTYSEEDEVSPPRTKNILGEPPITALEIQFEEDEEDLSENVSEKSPIVKKSYNDNEPELKKYITEILTASDFSWDAIYVRYLSSDQLLDTSLYDAEMEYSSDQPSNDYMLLLDLLNEVLVDSCAQYFGCSTMASYSKHKKRSILDSEDTLQEIVERVESHLRPSSNPRDVDHIASEEIFKDGNWVDFRSDVETIGTEIADLILQKLVIDTALSCFSFTDRPQLFQV